jgi:hypothetical protein
MPEGIITCDSVLQRTAASSVTAFLHDTSGNRALWQLVKYQNGLTLWALLGSQMNVAEKSRMKALKTGKSDRVIAIMIFRTESILPKSLPYGNRVIRFR